MPWRAAHPGATEGMQEGDSMSIGALSSEYGKDMYSKLNSRNKGMEGDTDLDFGKTVSDASETVKDEAGGTQAAKTKPTFMPYAGSRKLENTNEYFAMATGDTLTYNGVTFSLDRKANALTLGDVSKRKDCVYVGLAKGGSLIFNRDNTDGVMDALTMFSPEDQERIVKAIQIDNMAQKAKKEVEDSKDGSNIKSADDAQESNDASTEPDVDRLDADVVRAEEDRKTKGSS